MMVIGNRDYWNPPIKAPATPKLLNQRKSAPYTIYGRPVILNPKWATPHVMEEVDEFHDFLKDIRGSIRTRTGKIPIRHCSGKLLSWSYKPFREGYWKDFVTSGFTDPKTFYWYGNDSLLPNPSGNIVESPLTLVTSEEDILRFIGGSAKVRIFSSYQPTFPTFTVDEHSDSITDKINHKIKGEEFIATDGMILVIPRGWAYRIQLDESCIAVVRTPIHNVLSWASNMVKSLRSKINIQKRPKPTTRYTPIDESYSEGGSVSETESNV